MCRSTPASGTPPPPSPARPSQVEQEDTETPAENPLPLAPRARPSQVELTDAEDASLVLYQAPAVSVGPALLPAGLQIAVPVPLLQFNVNYQSLASADLMWQGGQRWGHAIASRSGTAVLYCVLHTVHSALCTV